MAIKVISGEQIAQFAQYQLPEVGSAARPPTVAELEKMREEFYREAREEGLRKGHEEGLAAAKRDAQAELKKTLQSHGEKFNQLTQALAKPFAELDETVEQQLVHLAMLLAQQIIRREIRTQPGEVVAVVREALAMLPSAARNVCVHVHPEDAQLLREATAAQDKSWKIMDEPMITRGGCRITTDNSFIDATLEKRLTALAIQVMGDERAGVRMLQTSKAVEAEQQAAIDAADAKTVENNLSSAVTARSEQDNEDDRSEA
jgi:flagellar assembly protein FliH